MTEWKECMLGDVTELDEQMKEEMRIISHPKSGPGIVV